MSDESFVRIFWYAMAIGPLWMLVGVWRLWKARGSRGWLTVRGKVTRSEVDVSYDSEGPTIYSPRVEYTYSVQGQQFAGKRVAFGRIESSWESHAREVTERYPLGSAVTVYYSPRNPKRAVLEPRPEAPWRPIVLGLIWTIGAAAAALSVGYFLSR